ncbi:Mechanosensitive ion channel protein 1 mitochondrial [Bienertia sinuspersici]
MIMARIWSSKLKSYVRSIIPSSKSLSSRCFDVYMGSISDHYHVRPIFGYLGHNYHTEIHSRILNLEPRAFPQVCKPNYASAFSPSISSYRVWSTLPLTPISGSMSYSSFTGSKGDNKGLEVPESSGIGNADVGGNVGISELVDKVKDGWKSVVDAVTVTGQKAKEASDQLTPYAEQVLESHPYLKDVVVPVGSTFTAAVLAWLVLPSILKRLHRYSSRGSAALLSGTGSMFAVEVPYEKSVWGALEDPLIGQTWQGALVLSGVWFVQRWKTNLFARALAAENLHMLDREKLLTLDRVTSLGLFAIGLMAFAEACGVAVQSIVTVGGIGGVATAFAARDILGNVLSGLSMQFTKPFSLGDTIKAGSIEGQVVEMGLTTTSLLNAEKFPVIVPNSMFSSQVIVNKSRAEWRAFVSRVPLQFHNLERAKQRGILQNKISFYGASILLSSMELRWAFTARPDKPMIFVAAENPAFSCERK